MEFGVHLPHMGRQATRENLLGFLREIDGLGLHSGWVSDHIAWPPEIASRYPYADDGGFPATVQTPILEPLTTLAFAAAATERLQLGTSVMVLGHRPPVQTAKQWATLDVLTGGRAILGVGVGWMKEEFDALQVPFDHRGERADEQREAFERLFREELPSYEGRYYRFPPIGFQPKPVRGRIPVWIGGDSRAAARRAARFGDCLHLAFAPLPTVVERRAELEEECTRLGREPGSIALSVRMFLDWAGIAEPKKSLGTTTGEVVERLGRYREAGVSHVLLDPVGRGGPAAHLESVRRFVAEVTPQLG